MGSLSYYLPVIIILVVIGAVIVFGISFIREYVRIKKDGSTCMYCKAEAPIYFFCRFRLAILMKMPRNICLPI